MIWKSVISLNRDAVTFDHLNCNLARAEEAARRTQTVILSRRDRGLALSGDLAQFRRYVAAYKSLPATFGRDIPHAEKDTHHGTSETE